MDEIWSGSGIAREVAVTPHFFYFSTFDYGGRLGLVHRMDRSTSAVDPLATWNAHGTCTSMSSGAADDSVAWSYTTGGDGGSIAWTLGTGATFILSSGHSCQQSLVATRDRVYWINSDSVVSAPVNGASATTVFWNAHAELSSLAISPDETVLFASGGPQGLTALPTAGIPEPRAIAGAGPGTTLVSADAANVYWFDPGTQTIGAAAYGDALAARVLSCGQTSLAGLTVDDRYVYWLDSSQKTIMRLAK